MSNLDEKLERLAKIGAEVAEELAGEVCDNCGEVHSQSDGRDGFKASLVVICALAELLGVKAEDLARKTVNEEEKVTAYVNKMTAESVRLVKEGNGKSKEDKIDKMIAELQELKSKK